jgi:hypothetical protein
MYCKIKIKGILLSSSPPSPKIMLHTWNTHCTLFLNKCLRNIFCRTF